MPLARAPQRWCLLPGEVGSHPVVDGFPPENFAEIVFPICEGDRPLAVLDAIARPDGAGLSGKDFMLLKDLVELASNVIRTLEATGQCLKRS